MSSPDFKTLFQEEEEEEEEEFFWDARKTMISKDGNHLPVLVSGSVLRSKSGEIQGIILDARDISRQLETEQKLAESEKRYRDLYRLAPFMYHSLTPDGTILESNQTELDALGYSHEEFVGKNLLDFVPLELLENTRKKFEDGLKTGKADTELSFVRKDGSLMPVSLKAIWQNDENGHPIFSRSMMVDISERKKAEEQRRKSELLLKESEELYRMVVDTSPDPIIVLDLNARILRASKRTFNLFGATARKSLINKRAIRFVAPEDRRWVMQEFRNVLERGKPKTMEFRIIRADGIPHPIEINVSLLKNEQGEVLSFIGVIRDIAERKRLEKEVLIRQEAIESSIGPILLADMDGKVTHANFAFLNLFGYSSEQKVLEQSIESLWKKEKPSEKIIETVQNEGVWRGERLGHDLKGNEFSLDVQIPLILDTSDDPIGLVCFLYDITLRKETEIKMRETSKMAALGEFVSGTAHEINNPIGIISGNAQYLLAKLDYDSLRKMGRREFNKFREAIEMINKHSLRCGGITQKLLAFGRGGIKTTMIPVSINTFIKDVLSIVGHQFELSEIKVVQDLKRLPRLQANADQMNQVFMNLLLNARTAMSKGGTLRVSSKIVESGNIQVEVEDTGEGIPEENMERIFEPFFTTRETGEGTGLGLAVVYSIVKAHHGNIRVQSKPGKGTRAILDLPLKVA